VQEYFPPKTTQTAVRRSSTPAFSEQDEEFLKNLTTAREHDSQVLVLDDAQGVPLPASPPAVTNAKTTADEKADKKAKRKSAFLGFASSVRSSLPFINKKGKDKQKEPTVVATEPEVAREEDELTAILNDLALTAEQNRAFSLSEESTALLKRFTQILRDLVAGGPHAYKDLENLLTDKDQQIKGMFDKLPSFLQNLVKTIPAKMAATMAPAMAAASSEKPGADGKKMGIKQAAKNIPMLKNLVKGDAIVAMLRTILNFLKLRFPAIISGTNVLLGLAVFLLLFVFWYCHKRGREERLRVEEIAGAESGSELEDDHGLGASKRLEESMKASTIPLPETPAPAIAPAP